MNAHQITKTDILDCKGDLQRLIDAHGGATIEISRQELGAVLRNLGYYPSEQQLRNIYRVLDSNGDGILDVSDFVHLLTAYKTADIDEDLREAFRIFDKDDNGFISKAELRHVMTSLGEELTDEEVDEMIQAVDTDGDGQVSFQEFKQMMTNV